MISRHEHVTLLGLTIAGHLTFGEHINNTVNKCRGLLGMRRTADSLSKELRLLMYKALVRSVMEYASAVSYGASQTHLQKLEIIQKIASRIIFGLPCDAHANPLMIIPFISNFLALHIIA